MRILQTHQTIAEYCDSLNRKTLVVNRKYQRQPGVWPTAARSFFIESILLGFPVPKISLFAKTDRTTLKTVREIVDGQQRTLAIKAFYDGTLRLSPALDFDRAAGRTYSQLDPDLQDQFLSYSLDIDEFVATTPTEIREVFRRMNSYVVALNAEERRHATWQGSFKWYIYHLSNSFDQAFDKAGVFTERQLVRMQDMKLFAEITHALINGITTTDARKLNQLYKEYDVSFALGDQYTEWIRDACYRLLDIRDVLRTTLVKPYSYYSFVVAAIHAVHDVPRLRSSLGEGGIDFAPVDTITNRLVDLLAAVEDKDDTGIYGSFVTATISKTNVQAHRIARATTFLDALRVDGGGSFRGSTVV